MRHSLGFRWKLLYVLVLLGCAKGPEHPALADAPPMGTDPVFEWQEAAIRAGRSPIAHWGTDKNKYTQWSTHSNRLVPVYTFGTRGAEAGVALESYQGEKSPYRNTEAIERLYGRREHQSLNPRADYFDQTNIHDLQAAALAAGKRYIILVVFDGMSWHATRAAAIAQSGQIYHEGRGSGLFVLDYKAQDTTQYGFMVTSPYSDDPRVDVDLQAVTKCIPTGGYNPAQGGDYPWSEPPLPEYLKGKDGARHPYTDSASSATSMSAGIKTYNAGINVTVQGKQVVTIAHRCQQAGYAVGTVTSVPLSHATPAAMYAHNVHRDDYQDLTRDLLGLPSVSHPRQPLPGLDVVIGAGFGVNKSTGKENEGNNFVAGNAYLTDKDREAVNYQQGGQYVVCQRAPGKSGGALLLDAAKEAVAKKRRLLGFFGTRYGHLPYRTTNGDYKPSAGLKGSESYSTGDVQENPTLAEATNAALEVLGQPDATGKPRPFWLMVEAGDVDFAKHDNNLDNMIGAIYSGDAAVRALADWVEKNASWKEAVMIVTADHGHYLVLDDLEALAKSAKSTTPQSATKVPEK